MLSKRKRVPPFGNPRIKAYWQLPEAYRSLLRPSSALYAKASIKCPYFAYFPNLCAEINLHMTLVFEFKILSYLEILNLFAFSNFTLKYAVFSNYQIFTMSSFALLFLKSSQNFLTKLLVLKKQNKI